MYNNESPVDDTLLRKLSTETQLIGKQVIIKGWADEPESQAVISNVIVLPTSILYRNKFMGYYEMHAQNAVKALKELVKNYPNSKDYLLDTGYVMILKSTNENPDLHLVKNRGDFMLLDDLAMQRQEILKSGLKVVKGSKTAGSVK
jgi:hypothetical protein